MAESQGGVAKTIQAWERRRTNGTGDEFGENKVHPTENEGQDTESENEEFHETTENPLVVGDSTPVDRGHSGNSAKQDVTFEETQEALIIRWIGIHNATQYKLKCKRTFVDETVEKNLHKPECDMKRDTYGWRIGEKISVTITAVDNQSNMINVSDAVKYVIGGDKVPHGLQLKYNGDSSHKSLILEWQKPKIPPQLYEVMVYQKINEADKLIHNLNTPHLTIAIDDLRHSTETYCIVKCKYPDGDGKPAWSKSLKTRDLPPELRKSQEINAFKDPCNRVRQITVKWQEPDQIEVDRYEVYLIYNHNQKSETQHVGAKKPKIANFKSLKSDTEYKACVVTFAKNKNDNLKAYSEVVRTDKARKLDGFNIKEKGKPIIKTCTGQQQGDDIYGIFEWSLPDLGEEANNYKLAPSTASLKMSGTQKVSLEVDEKHCRTEKVKLSWGKSYSFTVRCSYLEYDTDELHEASETDVIKTDIGKPSIGDVNWHAKNTAVPWTPAKGAKEHTLKIKYEAQEGFEEVVSKVVKNSPINVSAKHMRYGKICYFIIEASCDGERKENAEKKILIGGDEAVTEVVANKDETNPRRAILVKWEPPKQKPQGYQVMLYNLDKDKGLKEEVNPLESSQRSHRFIDLKTETNYRIKVCPIYNGCASEGTLSNVIRTNRKVTPAAENQVGFGQPTNIMHAVIGGTADNIKIALTWSPVQMGENFKVTGYQVFAYQKGYVRNTTISKQKLGSNESRIELDLKRGQRYDVKVTTNYLDLETTKSGEKSRDYEIFTDPSKTTINDCNWSEGVIHFSWQPVAGATKYQLIIKDEFFKKKLAPDKDIILTSTSDGCSAEIKANEDLRIGRTCMTKVISHSEGNRSSESEWKAHLLGGKDVPRNVTASRCSENPERAVNLTFDAPMKGASSLYKIVITPEFGMTRTIHCQTSTIILEYLRKGVTYEFVVYAKWRNIWSEGSPSNSVQTDGAKGKSIVDFHGSSKASFDLRNAIMAGQNTEFNVSLGKDFGQVQDLRAKLTSGRDKDIMQLQWHIPSFDKKSSDYKVENYKIDIWRGQDPGDKSRTVDFEKEKVTYESEKFDLDLGESYQVAVSTLYLDIDQDCLYKSSSVTRTVHTRPQKPTCTRNNHTEDFLIIEWNAAKGAKRYQIEINADGSEKATFVKDMHGETVYRKKFDESFGFGSAYYAKITAFGAEEMSNSEQTPEKIIGGERVPTNVVVTSDHPQVHDPNSEVFLKWSAPQLPTNRYEISSVPPADTMRIGNIIEEECLVSGLKAGTEYFFKVQAVHEENGILRHSGGCSSKKIRTNPTPTQVKNVSTRQGINPSTSAEIIWDKVEAEKENEMTKYRVVVWKADETAKREEVVDSESVVLYNLESGSTYYVTVAGGNSIGYGKDSEKVRFCTELGTPKNVILQNNKEKPTSSIFLSFQSAEGHALKYLATLYKCVNMIPQELGDSTEVQTGHFFNDLEPNTDYQISLHATFPNGDGKPVTSNHLVTAPSKTKVTEADCNIPGGGKRSPREIFVTWISDQGCHIHEIKIMRGSTRTVESRLLIENKSEVQYSCLYESTDYAIQVRSQNSSGCFGEWSNIHPITLAPAKLQGISANLEEDGYVITVRCNTAQLHSPFYFMQALKDKEKIGEPIQSHANKEVVEWKFNPPEYAQKYNFELWAEDARNVEGEKTFTDFVISRPQMWQLKTCKYHPDNASTDIEVMWDHQVRCDNYEINFCVRDQNKAESVVRTTEKRYRYRCQVPGSTYLVSIRAICGNVKAEWSADQHVELAPAEVDIMERLDGEKYPVESITVRWEPLRIAPTGYFLNLICNGQEVDVVEKPNDSTGHVFKDNLKPGALYYCTVAAFKDYGDRIMGKATRSNHYQIKWNQASNFTITLDENEPSRRVKMRWDTPEGVDSYKLEIENNQSGVVTPIEVTEPRYIFDSGIPGNTYTVRLHCGCDNRYDIKYIEQTMTIKPEPPTDLRVTACDKVNGLMIEFKDTPSARKQYRITAHGLTNLNDKSVVSTSQHSLILRDMVPGESYKVSVCTIVGDLRSKEETAQGYICTLPDEVVNLRSHIGKDSILFEWDNLKMQPSKYIVQWKVDNEPIIEEHTQAPSFKIFFLKPAHCYSARVMAVNSSGAGPMSNWENFITDPTPPYGVTVYPNKDSPETSLIVKFQDEKDPLKTYRIVAMEAGDETITVVIHYSARLEFCLSYFGNQPEIYLVAKLKKGVCTLPGLKLQCYPVAQCPCVLVRITPSNIHKKDFSVIY